MARPTIENIRNLGDFMVSNLWEVSFTAPKGAPGVSQFLRDFNFKAVNFELPKRTGNTLDITIRGHKVRQPGDYDYSGTVTLTLAETEDSMSVHELVEVWREYIIQTNTNAQFKKRDIEINAIIRRLGRDNRPLPGRTWVLVGVFLEDYDLGGLTETGDVIQPTITLSYDYFFEENVGVPGA